jgi:hypothetical protein
MTLITTGQGPSRLRSTHAGAAGCATRPKTAGNVSPAPRTLGQRESDVHVIGLARSNPERKPQPRLAGVDEVVLSLYAN